MCTQRCAALRTRITYGFGGNRIWITVGTIRTGCARQRAAICQLIRPFRFAAVFDRIACTYRLRRRRIAFLNRQTFAAVARSACRTRNRNILAIDTFLAYTARITNAMTFLARRLVAIFFITRRTAQCRQHRNNSPCLFHLFLHCRHLGTNY